MMRRTIKEIKNARKKARTMSGLKIIKNKELIKTAII